MKNKVTFFGDKGWIFLCSIVLAAIGGLAFVACDDGSTDEDEPTQVTLAAGSQGIAGDKTITGLTAQQKYLVKTNGKWYKVNANGTLGVTQVTPLSISSVGTPDSLTGTAITGLTNEQTYDVYIYLKPGAGDTVGGGKTKDTKKKNAMIDLSTYVDGNVTGALSLLAAAGDQVTLVFLMGGTLGIKSGGGISDQLLSGSTIPNGGSSSGGLKYTFDFSGGNAGSAKITAVEGNRFFTVNKINNLTNIIKITTNTGTA